MLVVILLNAVVLGAETFEQVERRAGGLLSALDKVSSTGRRHTAARELCCARFPLLVASASSLGDARPACDGAPALHNPSGVTSRSHTADLGRADA
jgi:hypothetical protein